MTFCFFGVVFGLLIVLTVELLIPFLPKAKNDFKEFVILT
tara:strand:+ start:473 stop:592 length:120 start_codon:yes stop_codon:yes gene_type:complete